MSHQIASAIILNGIFYHIHREGEELSGWSILKTVPSWFVDIHPREKFPKSSPPVPDPENNQDIVDNWKIDPCYDLPEHLKGYEQEVDLYLKEKRIWDRSQDLIVLRKWVFWCVDFCDIQRGFSLTYNYEV
jgi:hypothetical protein